VSEDSLGLELEDEPPGAVPTGELEVGLPVENGAADAVSEDSLGLELEDEPPGAVPTGELEVGLPVGNGAAGAVPREKLEPEEDDSVAEEDSVPEEDGGVGSLLDPVLDGVDDKTEVELREGADEVEEKDSVPVGAVPREKLEPEEEDSVPEEDGVVGPLPDPVPDGADDKTEVELR